MADTTEKTTRVKFTEDYLHETEGRNKGHQFKAGEVYDLRDDLAQAFIGNGVAVATDSKPAFKPVTRLKVGAEPDDGAAVEGAAVEGAGKAAPDDKAKAAEKTAADPATTSTTADVKQAAAKSAADDKSAPVAAKR